MAHQANAIPWHTLADSLTFQHCSPRNHGVTNLYLRKTKDPDQVKRIRHFVRGFARALSAYSTVERNKFDPEPTPPELNEIIISDAAVRKMAKTVLRYKSLDGIFTIPDTFDEILSPYERSAANFAYATVPYEGDMNDDLGDACELTKALLMYGEMDALFKLAAHPDVYFHRIWTEEQYANSHGFGLSHLVDAALQAYICLNVILLRPELYDDSSRDTYIRREMAAGRNAYKKEEYDYKLTAAYQEMLLKCTGVPYGWRCETHTWPHREFFGVLRGQYLSYGYYRISYDDTHYGRWQKANLGTQRVDQIAHSSFQGTHIPSREDVAAMFSILEKKGLPAELSLQILDVAGYASVGRLPVSNNPLHAANTDELKKYVSYCWKLLVRTDMLCRASVHGGEIDWEAQVSHTLYTLFNMPGRSLFSTATNSHEYVKWKHSRKVLVS